MRRIGLIETLVQDLQYGMRMLGRNPGFTFVAVLILALGIGANTAIFSVVNAVLLRSLPYRDPDRLVIVSGTAGGYFLDWRDQAKAFEKIAAYTPATADLKGSGEPERLDAGAVSADLFATLGVAPAVGRTFTPEEDTYRGPPAVILSDSLWRRRFGGDPQVIGRALTVGDQSRTIVGIMPPGFRFPGKSDLWLPLAFNITKELAGEEGTVLDVIARLKPGVTPEAASTETNVIIKRKNPASPGEDPSMPFRVTRLDESLVGNVRLALLILFGAVAFVLLIACANVANLFLARSAARQKEMSIRAAVGAGRLRLVRQLLTERLIETQPTIVGVVGDTRHSGLDKEVSPEIYLPYLQHSELDMFLTLAARVASNQNNPASLSNLAAAIRNQVQTVEPNEPVNQVVTMDERLSNSIAGRRYVMLLLSIFAAVAFVIATVGIYGVISYAVNQRTHEIGVRMALGAQSSDVLRMVIWRGMSLTLIGVALGLAAALGLTRVLKYRLFNTTLLFNVSATDPLTFALITLLLVGVALIASYIPARRATKVDPLQALRHE